MSADLSPGAMKVFATLALILATSTAFLAPAPLARSLIIRDGLWDSFKESMEVRDTAASPTKRARAMSVSRVSASRRATTRGRTAPTPGRKLTTGRKRPHHEPRSRRAKRRGSQSWRTSSGRPKRRRTPRPRGPSGLLRQRRPRRRRKRLRQFSCPSSKRRGTSEQ